MTRVRRLWLGLGAVFVAFVIYESLAPNALDAGTVGEVKAGHVLAYAWLMLWYLQAYANLRARVLVGVALVLMGVALEFAQGMTGYRTFAWSDMRDNALGVAIGFALGWTPLANVVGSLR